MNIIEALCIYHFHFIGIFIGVPSLWIEIIEIIILLGLIRAVGINSC